MIKEIKKVKVRGKCFDCDTTIDMFGNEKQRLSIIFGRNGSGKSSIAEGVDAFKEDDNSVFNRFEFLDGDSNNIILTPENKEHLFVFNEEFVEANIKLKEDGLDTIVMIGDQVDIDKQIDETTELLNSKLTMLEKEKNDFQIYIDMASINNPNYHWKKIKETLKSTDNWVDTELLITGKRHNVTDAIIKRICTLSPKSTLKELEDEFEKKYSILKSTNEDTKLITKKIEDIIVADDIEDKILVALAKKVEKPTLTERDNKILDVIVNNGQKSVESIKQTFSDENVDYCPFCFQTVTEKHKLDLILGIERVFNQEFEEHKTELQNLVINDFNFNNSDYLELDEKIRIKILESIEKVNRDIKMYNNNLDKKIENVYKTIDIQKLGLIDKVKEVNINLRNLEIAREEFNGFIANRNKLIKELSMLNKQISHYKVADSYNEFTKQTSFKEKAMQEIRVIENDVKSINNSLVELMKKKESVEITISQMNKGLEYIFFDKNRLKVEYGDGNFVLKSNNKSVRPSDISLGERNILALCYYFMMIQSNKSIKEQYKTKCMLIFDDPISSFDLENRIGIHSFIKSQLLKVLLGNVDSKVIILTHDLGAVYDFEKTAQELNNACTKKYGKDSTHYTILELENKATKSFLFKKRNEYSTLIQNIFQFAKNNCNDLELVIGNMMRRVLEAFSTFEYKLGMAEVSCNKDVLNKLGEDEYIDYFENVMYRLVLNGESHFEEVAKSIPNNNYYEQVTTVEKRRTAKDVLCFIYLLNPEHLSAHLNNATSISEIAGWCSNIKNNSSSVS